MKARRRLTIKELRNYKGFENYTDQQAEETIKALDTLSILFYELYMRQKQREHTLKIIKLYNEDEFNIAA